jgi:adenosylcobinamide-GDP ribazoletransferase
VLDTLTFLTAFGRARRSPSPPDGRALKWFPLVGALIGLALGGLWWCLVRVWPAPIGAVIVVAADLAITGLLHLDGLADAADGLLPPLPSAARRLEVMRDPSVGAFAVGVVSLVLLSRWVVIATLRPAPLLIGALWCISRTGMAAVMQRVPYARAGDGNGGHEGVDGGLASAFMGGRLPAWLAGLAISASIGAASVWELPAGTVAAVSGVVAFAAVIWFGVRRVGGFTGDVLGAAGLVGETVGLLVAAAKW